MKAHLMYRNGDLDLEQELPSNKSDLMQDLELRTLFTVMARGDEFLFGVAQHVVLSGFGNDLETILYRQEVLRDCLRNEVVVRSIYGLADEAILRKKQDWLGIFARYPGGILSGAVGLLEMYLGVLDTLKSLVEEHAKEFKSEGFTTLFAMLEAELSDEYFATVKKNLKTLKFRNGVLISAQLGEGNEGTHYALRKSASEEPGWLQRFLTRWRESDYTFYIAERDEAGARALSELRDKGINLVANALAQSADHILSFFVMLRTELAFYIGGVNLHRLLEQQATPVCFPVPAQPSIRRHACVGLRDVCLGLSLERDVVGNDLAADGENIVIITGANQGGKSTFLRGIGLGQLMMQCGLFVTAKSFSANLCRHLFTHYKREEDVAMESGKFDEELVRMSVIAKAATPDSMVLFNESFAATNEREGSEIARQIVRALLERRIKIFFVTHQFDFAYGLWVDHTQGALFLRAERRADGQRTFKLLPGEPLETSFGADLYAEIFEVGEAKLN